MRNRAAREAVVFRCVKCGALNRVSAGAAGTPVCGRCKETLDVSGAVQAVNGGEMERAIASSPIPVVVDFWAPWCAPCRFAGPILDQYARAHRGRVLVLKLNTDENPGPSQRLGIRGIPTFIVFKGGAEAARQSGAMPLQQLTQFLAPYVDSAGAGVSA